ncbi:MAG TPA: PAS domain S-box protein [Trueperaceae bacterium]
MMEQKPVESDLPQQTEQTDDYFRKLLGQLPAAAYACDAEGLVTYYNPRAVALWGRAPRLNDPAHRYCGSFRPLRPDGLALDRNDCFMALALKNDRGYDAQEVIIERPDGTRRTVLAYINPVHDDDGRLLGAINTLVDISDRKLTEEAPARLAAIVESSDDAIVSKDLTGGIRSWNRGAEELFGFSAEEAVGRSITLIIPEDRLDEENEILGKLRRGERIDHFETVRRRKDGSLIDISLTVSPIKDGSGQVVGASKIARDITEVKRAQEALQEQARTLRTINEVAGKLSGELDLKRLVRTVTDAGRELSRSQFGAFFYSEQGQHGAGYTLMARSGDMPEGFDEEYVLGSYPEVFGAVEGAARPKPGPKLNSHLAVPVVPRSGKALGVLFFGDERPGVFDEQLEQVIAAIGSHAATAIDNALLYEEARELNESLEEKVEQRTADLNALNQELETFNYSVAHDLRGSLRGIDGFSSLILEESGDELSDTTRRYLNRVRAGAQRMGQLLDNLLELSRLMRAEVLRQHFDLHSMARSIIEDLREWEPEREVEVVIADCPLLVGDPGLMRIAMENLLGNAWKFSRHRSPARIEVGCEERDGNVVYYVRDNGIGFDDRFEDKLFEPFQRLHAPDAFEGTGIGLANTKRIIDKHGGRIWATSAPDQGATFYFTL